MSVTASPLLLAAQRELEKRREGLARERAAAEQRPIKNGRDAEQRPSMRIESARQESARQESREPTKTAVSWQLYNGQKELVARRKQAGISREDVANTASHPIQLLIEAKESDPASARQESAQEKLSLAGTVAYESVRVYPTLATAVLRAELAAAGRLYWLLRHVDGVGRGWLAEQQIREMLTGKGSVLRVCGWRRLRQLLQQGQGKLWERDGRGRLWLYSPARILERLDGDRLEGRPVAVPVAKLLGGIGEVRAYLYATFHAGRLKARPITRATIRGKTAVSATTQRRYEQIDQIRVQANVALGGRWGAAGREQVAWERGRAVFEFVDGLGEQGIVNGRYIAWRLGNSYESGLVQLPKGRQKKLNRRLPLVIDGRGGREAGIGRLYYPNGKLAAQAAARKPARDHYFPTPGVGLWHVVGGSP